jgi:hypothetical protein
MTKRLKASWQGTDWLALAVLTLLLVPLLTPLQGSHIPVTHDGHHHLFRLYALDLAIRGGSLWPRWLPDMGFGYGFPVFNYYGPLVYYVGELLHIVGIGFLDTLRILIGLGFVLPAWAFYCFARYRLGAVGALIGALIYSYLPYHVADGYVRAALPEHWSFLFPPLLMLVLWRYSQRKQLQWVLVGALLLAAFVLLHNLSVILFTPMLAVYAMGWLAADLRGTESNRWREWLRRLWEPTRSSLPGYLLMALLAIGLTAFFVLPGALEIKYIHASTISTKLADYASLLQRGVDVRLLFPWEVPPPDLTKPLYLVVLGALGALVGWKFLKPGQRWHLYFAVFVAAMSLFLMLRASRPLLEFFPQLAYLQFPWRWNAPLTFALAYIAGHAPLLAKRLPPAYGRFGEQGVVIVILGLFLIWLVPTALPGNLETVATVPTEEKILEEEDLQPGILQLYDFQTGLWLRTYGGPWLFEYLPVWAEDARDNWFLPDESNDPVPALPVVPTIRMERQAALEQSLRVESAQTFPLRWHTFYFPGWEVLVDNQRVETYPSTPLGLVTADIPAGVHYVELRFGLTPVRRIGLVISLLTGLLFLGLVVRSRQGRLGLVLIGVALLMFLPLKWRQISASTVSTPTLPTESWTIFEDRAQLLGYHVQGEARPGQVVQVTLYWQALRKVADNDQVFVSLSGYDGRVWAQTDRSPGYSFTPTSRWQPGELIPDTYPLAIPGDLPPGNYQLRMGLYDPGDLTRRTVHDLDGNTADQVWLGDVEIAPSP